MTSRGPVVAALALPALAVALVAGAAGTGPASPAPDDRPREGTVAAGQGVPLVVGHRGASGYRPEHTLASYRLAIRMGADYVEPDLVATKDGVLVARHENEIAGTTDVEDHPEFADRRTARTIDGVRVEGWFTEDFTLAELKTLRAEERIPDVREASSRYDGRYEVPTFGEVLDLVAEESERSGRTVGVAPETKHPTYFDSIGLSMEEPLVEALHRAGLHGRRAPVMIQSFETGNLRELDRLTRVDLVQLVAGSGAPYDRAAAGSDETYDDLLTDRGLLQVSRYADWIGPDKSRVVPLAADGTSGAPTDLVDRAHEAGLQVVVHTFRDENEFLPLQLRAGVDPTDHGDALAEYDLFFSLGVDAVFSDHPGTALEARDS